ncbi:MAG: hypothetical protein CSA09_02100 [Candidatus Contendobacter odensis]|uniref:DUF72 domain-containing protein n=1 Tax=Candidatus Contendibacter odensensis TaxID=1400860 RepID=A0A2G6PFE3_9GAMM|nr:MAG: hypothetical protein CSA09_02100 [Candidatus Contendobacter odensis]
MTLARYHLGCPVWSNRDWVGRLFTMDAKPVDFLHQYSMIFNTVEGNSCFYGLPRPETIVRWRENTVPGFRFCFKFPRVISHERRLRHATAETTEFLERIHPLLESSRLGPSFLQLPPGFGVDGLPILHDFLSRLPKAFPYAVEVRHLDFFNKGDSERQLNRMLLNFGIDRVMLDSRALFAAQPVDQDMYIAQGRKPRLPVHAISLGRRPFIRYIGHPDVEKNRSFFKPWLDKLVLWLDEGQEPYVFIHTPNNQRAPCLAQLFHEELHARYPEVGALNYGAASEK